jgi:NapH/MauN family ferredoxin-type protein
MDKKHLYIRYGVLIFFLVAFAGLAILHQVSERSYASVDALCPFGGFETLYTFVATGGFVPRILMSGFVLAVGIILTVIILKRGFCGYICPFGTIQELIGKITAKKISMPLKMDKYARYIKYVILAVILFGSAYFGALVFREYDPFIAFFHFGKGIFWGELETTAITGVVILAITLLLSIFIERAWCRYFCPLGAIMAVFSKIGLTKIKRDNNKCTNCKICDKTCPVNVKVSTVDTVKDSECINCNICLAKCPEKALSQKTFGKEISLTLYLVLLVVLFFSVIGLSMAFGVWQSKQTTDLTDASGVLLPANIKGWMTLEEVSNETKIPLGAFYTGLNLPDNADQKMPLKDLAGAYNLTDFDTQDVRDFVSLQSTK